MKKTLQKVLGLAFVVAAAAPEIASATYIAGGTTFGDLLSRATKGIQEIVIPLLIGLAVLTLIWNAWQFMTSADDLKDEYKGKLVRSLIGLFVIFAFWGLIAFLSGTLQIGIGGGAGIPTPELPR
jgi:hypothetical protein